MMVKLSLRRVCRALMACGVLVMVAATSAACSTYRIKSAEDHGEMPVLKLETIKTTFALLFSDVEHQFWLCQDTGDELVCRRSCGTDRDLRCPTSVVSEGGVTSNTR